MVKDLNYIFFRIVVFITVVSFCSSPVFAQPSLPQRNISITATQGLHFGTFALTGATGGTVTVGFDGNRTASPGIYLSSLSPTARPALFDIKLCQGRNVTVSYVPTTTLTGSNGGSFTLNIGPTEKGTNGAVFAVDNNCTFVTVLRVGGTLSIPAASPAGVYTGYFEITFDQQ
ncbi:hypothetical protein FFWV33_02500 [Flavobacterium faecale]|uniref:DUF4402 domain-containing protein n=1 Tax=Flavobacterium faecale TaxID=1355330 RepID=A0A2S1L9X9_9FLAO|nr:DUF4402 domain-containing protein [Flavobacterium faecale]AWG20478.1 hypothetical protein FFWV33_02500 [Flavobacterium faecale]